ncbi:DUF2842 domain-containing protein [Aliishimia ponticola]|uniref:DUF2842 domain-containing protein n=1 Tax=Aliishimia ponticola TaxID=2499833 RepID=A0A4S4N9A0_9RHOB|nr:DUF2842 domain-containing protein [Aliishimia ponticola]THH35739.1 DUF2842 domain-containing protein [Aliishimia ponticola]
MNYKTRKRLSLLVLILGLPAYIVVAVTIVGLFDRPSIWLELLVYVGLGVIWIAPLKRLFLGVGQADPDDIDPNGPDQ